MSVPDAKFTKGEFQVGKPPPSPPLAFLPHNPPHPAGALGMLGRSEFLDPDGSLMGWDWLSASRVDELWLKTA